MAKRQFTAQRNKNKERRGKVESAPRKHSINAKAKCAAQPVKKSKRTAAAASSSCWHHDGSKSENSWKKFARECARGDRKQAKGYRPRDTGRRIQAKGYNLQLPGDTGQGMHRKKQLVREGRCGGTIGVMPRQTPNGGMPSNAGQHLKSSVRS